MHYLSTPVLPDFIWIAGALAGHLLVVVVVVLVLRRKSLGRSADGITRRYG